MWQKLGVWDHQFGLSVGAASQDGCGVFEENWESGDTLGKKYGSCFRFTIRISLVYSGRLILQIIQEPLQTSGKIAQPSSSPELHDKLFLSLRIFQNENRRTQKSQLQFIIPGRKIGSPETKPNNISSIYVRKQRYLNK